MDTQAIVKVNSKVPPLVKLVAVASHKTLGSAETQSRLLSAASAPSASTVAMLTWTPGAGEDTCGVDLQLRPVDALRRAAAGAGWRAGAGLRARQDERRQNRGVRERAGRDGLGRRVSQADERIETRESRMS